MTGEGTGRRRPRRSTATAQRLERMRENKARLDAEHRDKQRREEAALEAFAEHEVAIATREQQRDHVIAGYEEKIARERARACDEVAEVRAKQAAELRELRAADRTPAEIAALVELPLKQVHRLLREAGQATERLAISGSSSRAAEKKQTDRSGESGARQSSPEPAQQEDFVTGVPGEPEGHGSGPEK